MVDKIEMSLDDIIKMGKNGRQRPGGVNNKAGGAGGKFRNQRRNAAGGRAAGGNRVAAGRVQKGGPRGGGVGRNVPRGDVNSAWRHDLFEGGKKGRLAGALASAKLMVSNLDFGVSDTDINELFAEFGPLKSACVHYDRSGRSLGTADVIFERRADAAKAMKQYNGVPLDGRPMNIQLATSEVPQPMGIGGGASPRKRIGGGGPVANKSPRRNMRGGNGPQNNRRGQQGGRGGRGGGGAGGRRNTRGPQKTAEELDAELEAYSKEMK